MPVVTSPEAACGRCSYFAKAGEPQASLGTCHFNPPAAPSGDAHGVWPKVETSDWCGHFAGEAVS